MATKNQRKKERFERKKERVDRKKERKKEVIVKAIQKDRNT